MPPALRWASSTSIRVGVLSVVQRGGTFADAMLLAVLDIALPDLKLGRWEWPRWPHID